VCVLLRVCACVRACACACACACEVMRLFLSLLMYAYMLKCIVSLFMHTYILKYRGVSTGVYSMSSSILRIEAYRSIQYSLRLYIEEHAEV
jgi:hypothetical protein